MEKQMLIDALSNVDNATAVKAIYSFDREYATTYECEISRVTVIFNKTGNMEAVLQVVENSNNAEKDVVVEEKTSSMTKEMLVQALNILDEKSPVTAIFRFKDKWSSSYKASIVGLDISFDVKGVTAAIRVLEWKPDEGKAAA